MEADEPSLYSRREKVSLQCAIRLDANPSNPAHEVLFPPKYVELNDNKPKSIKLFGIRNSPLLKSAIIKPQNIEKHFTPNIPVWCLKQPEILFDLHYGKMTETNSENYKLVIRIIRKIIQMGQKKTQMMFVLLYQPTTAIYNVFLMVHLFSLLKQKQVF